VRDTLEDRLELALHLLRLAGNEGDLRARHVRNAVTVDPVRVQYESDDLLPGGPRVGLQLERRAAGGPPARVRPLRRGDDLEVGGLAAAEVQAGRVVDHLPLHATNLSHSTIAPASH